MDNYEINAGRLVPLSNLKDYKIAKDNPDILGWRVVGADGESLGIVKDLIVDPKAMKARYLAVVANRRFFNTSNDQYLLIPIGAAALDKGGRNVFVSSIDSKSIARYPVYTGGPITDEYEYAVRDNLRQSQREFLPDAKDDYKAEFGQALQQQPGNTRRISDDFYNNDTYNEDRFYTYNQEINRDRIPARDYAEPDYSSLSAEDLHKEVDNPRTVESSITTIERLDHLRQRGSISDEEYLLLKRRALDL
ncbi:PRC-barrel domain-containing protein [Botryobacter ruber]|uniref:PRC-barrel domain-containing protein n=1 Tax=Botryobacter ruber TaxID=2171629 RepID=UPI000E0BCD0C|nr:PRC-barrel domain-containing protein [Botryobacter ruber]